MRKSRRNLKYPKLVYDCRNDCMRDVAAYHGVAPVADSAPAPCISLVAYTSLTAERQPSSASAGSTRALIMDDSRGVSLAVIKTVERSLDLGQSHDLGVALVGELANRGVGKLGESSKAPDRNPCGPNAAAEILRYGCDITHRAHHNARIIARSSARLSARAFLRAQRHNAPMGTPFTEVVVRLAAVAGGWRALARMAGGMSDSTVRGWRDGKRLPTGTSVRKLANGLELREEEILGYEPLPPEFLARIPAKHRGHSRPAPISEGLLTQAQLDQVVTELMKRLTEAEIDRQTPGR